MSRSRIEMIARVSGLGGLGWRSDTESVIPWGREKGEMEDTVTSYLSALRGFGR